MSCLSGGDPGLRFLLVRLLLFRAWSLLAELSSLVMGYFYEVQKPGLSILFNLILFGVWSSLDFSVSAWIPLLLADFPSCSASVFFESLLRDLDLDFDPDPFDFLTLLGTYIDSALLSKVMSWFALIGESSYCPFIYSLLWRFEKSFPAPPEVDKFYDAVKFLTTCISSNNSTWFRLPSWAPGVSPYMLW